MKARMAEIALFGLALAAGCAKEESPAPVNRTLSAMDIQGAKGLIIAPVTKLCGETGAWKVSPEPGSSVCVKREVTVNRLFRTTASGFVEEVHFYSTEGEDVTEFYLPTEVCDFNADYLVIVFQSPSAYIVNKTTGVVHAFGDAGVPNVGGHGYKNRELLRSDSSGNMYYEFNDGLWRLDLSNPASLSAVRWCPETDIIDSWQVDADGNVIYYANWNTACDYRVRKTNGGLYNLQETTVFWTGPDGQIYYYARGPFGLSNQVYRVEVDGTFNVTETPYGPTFDFEPCTQDIYAYMVQVQGRIIILNSASPFRVSEMFNPGSSPREVPGLPGFTSIKAVAASDNYYYIAADDASNQPVIVKVDPLDDSWVLLTTPGEYDVYKMDVSKTDTLAFNALRMSDGVKVIGEIDAANALAIIDETLNQEVIVLERVD
jgi:hypothetical protein